MSRNFVITILVFVAGLGIGYFARRAGIGVANKIDTHTADLAAIEKLHQEDVAVTLTQDPKGLIDVWSDEGIRINPGSPPLVGKQAIQADNEKLRAAYPEFKVLKYAPEIEDIQIADGWAIEVGITSASYKLTAKDDPVIVNDKGMRLLKRQSDGSWKFAIVGLQ
jgi:ketosteroid isomerase-like protein